MVFIHFKAGIDDAGRRLDKILRRFLSGENLSSLYKSLRKGLIKVNGKKCDGNFHVNEHDDIQIADFLLSTSAPSNKTEKSKLSDEIVILKNNAILILNKPYDIPVQPSANSKGNSLSEIVQADFELSHENSSLAFRTGPLHRLDRKTTGIIVFSQNLKGANWFSEAIKNHAIQKIYLALLEGKFCEKQIWKEKIEKLGNTNEQEKFKNEKKIFREKHAKIAKNQFYTVSVNSENGKNAYTEVCPILNGIFEGKNITLARILIKTGRKHQIRAQAAYHGFPLLGDTAYGGSKIDEKKWKQDFFLHAAELHFPIENPLGLPEKIIAPIPKAFEKIIENLKIPTYNQIIEKIPTMANTK